MININIGHTFFLPLLTLSTDFFTKSSGPGKCLPVSKNMKIAAQQQSHISMCKNLPISPLRELYLSTVIRAEEGTNKSIESFSNKQFSIKS